MNADPVYPFREFVVESRNAGIDALGEFAAGWRPKKPDRQHEAIIQLLEELSPEQRRRLFATVRYCIDMSMFKLLTNLNEGGHNVSFRLSMVVEGDPRSPIALIDDQHNRELHREFLGWVEDVPDKGP